VVFRGSEGEIVTVKQRRKRASKPVTVKDRLGEYGKTVASEASEPASKEEEGFLCDDPYWDDFFAAYFDPTLHVCCQIRY